MLAEGQEDSALVGAVRDRRAGPHAQNILVPARRGFRVAHVQDDVCDSLDLRYVHDGLAARRYSRNPGEVSDFAELAPFLAPADSAVKAAEQVAILGAREHEIGICAVGADCPQARVRLHRERRVRPGRSTVLRAQEHSGGTGCTVTDTHEELIGRCPALRASTRE